MVYQKAIKGLIAEAKQGLRFQELDTTRKVLLIIGLVPLIILTALLVAEYYILLFFYKGFAAPLDYLHKLVKDEAKDVKHATQFAIYWLAFPFIFFLYVLQSFAAFLFYFLWFEVMVSMYLVTLGGVKFQPFLMDAKFGDEIYWELKPRDTGITVFTVLLIIFDLLVAVNGLYTLGILEIFESYEIYEITSYGILGVAIMLFIVNPLLFKKTSLDDDDDEYNDPTIKELSE